MNSLLQYSHRLSKVMLDALHHVNAGKCSRSTFRNRRQLDEIHQALDSKFATFLARNNIRFESGNDTVVDSRRNYFDPDSSVIEERCRTKSEEVFLDAIFATCPKKLKWQRRLKHLVDAVGVVLVPLEVRQRHHGRP